MKKKALAVISIILLVLIIGLAIFLQPINIINGDVSNAHIVYAGVGYSNQVPTNYDGVDYDAESIVTTLKNGSIKRTFSQSYRDTPDSRILLEYYDDMGHHSVWIYVKGDSIMTEADTNSFVGRFSGDTELLINQINSVVNTH